MKNILNKLPKNKKPENMKAKIFSQIVTVIFIISVMILISSFVASNKEIKEVTISELATLVSENNIKKIEVELNDLKITKLDGTKLKSKKEYGGTLSETLSNLGVKGENIVKANIETKDPSGFGYYFSKFLPFLFPVLILFALIFFMSKGSGGAMQAFSFGSSRAKFIDPNDKKNRILFSDVAGAKEAKEELLEVVDFLKSPTKYLEIGAEIPKGVLMKGSPGTGKTLLARAVAGEAKVPFFSVSGSEFIEMFVGVGASRVRDLFTQAKAMAPAIIFIDEIDAIGRVRGTGTGGGNDEREQTLNQILTEMDGFEKNQKVIVIAATNRPEVLDPALLRPGRFDRRVTIDLPDREDREKILEIHSKKKPFEKDVDLKIIAERTPGFSGADLQSVMNEAAIFAARENRKKVCQNDLILAVEKVMMGPERKSHVLTKEEKRKTAYHEMGHALVASVLEEADPVHKVSIIPRGSAGGYTMSLPFDDKKLTTKSDFLANIAMALGGYIAEKMIFGEVSTGPSNDLMVASRTARQMVTKFGMSDKIGLLSIDNGGIGLSVSDYMSGEKAPISTTLSAQIDEEIKKIIDVQYKVAEKILKKHEEALHKMSEKLIEVETLERKEYEDLLKSFGIKIKKAEDFLKKFKVKKSKKILDKEKEENKKKPEKTKKDKEGDKDNKKQNTEKANQDNIEGKEEK